MTRVDLVELQRLSSGSVPLDAILGGGLPERRLERAILVLKARGTAHESGIRHFSIDASGPHVGGSFGEVRGALSGGKPPA